MNASIVPERQHRAAAPEPLLRKGVFSLLVHNNLDAEEAHIFLVSRYPVHVIENLIIVKT